MWGVFSISDWLKVRLNFLKGRIGYILLAIASPLLSAYIFGNVSLGWRSQIMYSEYQRQEQELQALVPPGSSVLGEGTWWWAFRGSTYTTDHYLSLIPDPHIGAEDVVDKALAERKIDVVLIDEQINFYFYTTGDWPSTPVEMALRKYASNRCRLLGTVEGYGYGVELGGPAIRRTNVYLCPRP